MEMLRRVGEALYGEHWQSPLARDLDVGARTVQRWSGGTRVIPAAMWLRIERLARDRRLTLDRLLAELTDDIDA